MTQAAVAREPVRITQRDYERCVCCGHIIGWHYRSRERCEHTPGIGEKGDCQCQTAICRAEAEAIEQHVADGQDIKYIKYMTGVPRAAIKEYVTRKLDMKHNGERWVKR